jgi:hypothetical protein
MDSSLVSRGSVSALVAVADAVDDEFRAVSLEMIRQICFQLAFLVMA